MITTDYKMEIQKTKHSKLSSVDFNNIPFGKVFSDHMFVVDYTNGQWQRPSIKPYGNLQLSPATSSLHYGQAIFEGMKANKSADGQHILLFRPEENLKRLNNSALRMAMPELPTDLFMQGLSKLVDLDRNWVPDVPDSALYMRPVMFATDNFIGVKAAENYKFIIFTCPVGPYYSKPVSVLVADKFVRAFEGGTGAAKAAGNYAGTLYPANLAKQQGYDQILWTDGKEHKYVEEIGTMNVFFIVDGQAYTPALTGTILPGITRKSVIQLLQDDGITVNEGRLDINWVIEQFKAGKLQDAFGVGTAATITHIERLGYDGKDYILPPIADRITSNNLKQQLVGIKKGAIADTYNWIVKV